MHRQSMKSGKFRARVGFTLIELLIVLMIFSVVTALFIANYRRFGNNITLSNVADEVALSVREMQTYGLASKRTTDNPTDFKRAFGIYVDGTTSYVMFEDSEVGNRLYDGTGELVSQYRLPVDIVFSNKCTIASEVPTTASTLHISFKRPDPDARIFAGSDVTPKTSAGLCLKSNQNNREKTVFISQSGQIEVLDECIC